MGFKIDLASLVVGRNLLFLLCFTLYLRAISKYKPPGGLYLEGRFNGRFFALPVWVAYIWRGLFLEFYSNNDDDDDNVQGRKGVGLLQITMLLPFKYVNDLN